jgi:hypothetical protein
MGKALFQCKIWRCGCKVPAAALSNRRGEGVKFQRVGVSNTSGIFTKAINIKTAAINEIRLAFSLLSIKPFIKFINHSSRCARDIRSAPFAM